ncbi:sigma-70 family RNA polymerase sigma factor [uncultured Sunxiuqinia sp.]|uniref:RNA polymerase sigma factor n=1 Tax=uncultured Sunxiuqinia sp. TaxID=1573825 RepID=UPI0030DCB870|tara:strand:- start:1328 stop:1963 length:636 start_codon:yes stop_codon:yes gene_type:complete
MRERDQENLDFLWHSFLDGDEKVFSVIYQQHINRLLSYGHKLCPNHEWIHDSIQEVYLDLFLKRKKLNGRKIENLKAYLFVSFRNKLLKKILQEKKFQALRLNGELESGLFQAEYNIQNQIVEFELSKEIKEALVKAVNSLPARQKEIIYLKFEEELEYSEISDILKISIDSARKLVYRALISLRKTLDPKMVQVLFYIFQKNNQLFVSMF